MTRRKREQTIRYGLSGLGILFALVLAGVGSAANNEAGLRGFFEEWSSAWEAVAAFGTLVAVAVSLGIASAEIKARERAEKRAEAAESRSDDQMQKAQDDEKLAREAAERDQAERVVAWVEIEQTASGLYRPVVIVLNASDLPIFDVTTRIHNSPQLDLQPTYVRVVAPGKEVREFFGSHQIVEYEVREIASLSFRDAVGRQWARDLHGMLTRLHVVTRG